MTEWELIYELCQIEEGLTEWEVDFVESISKQRKPLTEKQLHKAEELYMRLVEDA